MAAICRKQFILGGQGLKHFYGKIRLLHTSFWTLRFFIHSSTCLLTHCYCCYVPSRLVLGRGSYPNITQIAGTVVGFLPHSEGDASHVSGVKIRRPDLTIEELDASLVVGAFYHASSLLLPALLKYQRFIFYKWIDCTGPTRAGIKWLSQSGYGTTNANTDSSSKIALQNARISFDQKLQYSTLTCKVTPETLAKLPIPPDQTPETVTFTLLEDGVENGRRVIALIRGDGNESQYHFFTLTFMVFAYFVQMTVALVSLFAGQSSDESVKYESLDSMRSLAQDLKTYQKRPIPGWLYEAIDILEEAQPEIQFSHVRIREYTIRFQSGTYVH